MRLLPNLSLRSRITVQFAPADRFFLRLVPLAPDLPATDQAALALEGLAPFPPAQLYWGCCVAPARSTGLVYAAHRRRFTAEDTPLWDGADLVVPELLPLLGAQPGGAALKVLVGETCLCGAAWNGSASWPVAVHARDCGTAVTDEHRQKFAAELAARAGLPVDTPVTFLAGTPRARRDGPNLIFELADAEGAVVASTAVPLTDQDTLDVRDRAFLAQRRNDRRRGEFVWRLMLAGVSAAALALIVDLAALGFRLVDRSLKQRVTVQAAEITKLETAHGLANRVDELTHRRLRFFEMLSVINEPRPSSIHFTQTVTSGRNGIEIQAQTNAAADIGTFESALRKLASLDRVEARVLGVREGVTTFSLSVAFRTEPAAGNGGAP